MNNRLDQLQRLRSPNGFAERMEQIIQPADEAQRIAIRAALERSHKRFNTARKECGARFATVADSMHAELETLLLPEQQARLNEWRERDREQRRERDRRRYHSKPSPDSPN